ncbi:MULTISPECIES: carbohydrate ABC transporter permease [unclassified Pseudofrankia]|uniref:carbohydrate ABC transporter permease n=1 Tax=unclassified Pseudofrankia TaxID=2994372 RepID=UPI0008D9DB74|nr:MULTISPECIES: carbohydrate ABC transporter permease [unclassified Pseudofrankia]MDT3438196.1 carbohydrate ABC transporter permease [Pseudofrankia sp. BMG5.37]OHV46694.1 sugar ABC transporter permease [Pseudofrankia sp. BMG5.36]
MRTSRARTVALAAGAYLVAIVFLLPYVEMVITAGRTKSELLDANYFPKHFTFSNFTSLWSADGLGGNIWVSLRVAGGATLLALLVAIPAGYYTARHRFRGRTAFLLVVLATQMFQPAAMLVGLQREFVNFNLPSATVSLIIVNAGFNLAFAIWILNAFFSSIPVELEEAAQVDGLSRIGALVRITLPLAAPGIVTALIFTFITAWNEFLVALTLSLGSPPGDRPLTVAIDGYVGQYSTDWGHLFAGGLVATVPVIILFALIERRVVTGLTAGAVK